jgi:AGZA family xanthine/uracil permease-like MFS transporter
VRKAGGGLYEVAPKFGADLFIYGIIALSQGFILTAMVLAAILAFIIDRDFFKAGVWALAAAVLSAVGLMHAYDLTSLGVQNKFGWFVAPQFAFGYALAAGMLIALHFWQARANR